MIQIKIKFNEKLSKKHTHTYHQKTQQKKQIEK